MNKEIGTLTGLRAVAALWVFLYHASYGFAMSGSEAAVAKALGAAGFLGVDIFFVLSGFILAYNYGSRDLFNTRSYVDFLWKRIARIYPVHIAALVLLCVVVPSTGGPELFQSSHYSLEGLIRTLTLTHAWSFPIDKTWNTVSWSISCEWAAYLAFPLIAALSRRVRSPALIIALIACLFVSLSYLLYAGSAASFMSYGIPRIAVEFTSGVLLHRLWELNGFNVSSRNSWCAIAALGLMVLGGNYIAAESEYSASFYLPAVSCLVIYGMAAGKTHWLSLLSSPIALYLGRISFCFYMVHGFFMSATKRTLSSIGIEGQYMAGILLALALSLLFASAMFRFVEVPARKLFLRVSPRSLETVSTSAQVV